MTSPTHPTRPGELRGLARSIRDLFVQEPVERTPLEPGDQGGGDGGDVAWVAESPVRLPGDLDTQDPVLAAAARYLMSDPAHRAETRAALEEAAADARKRRAGQALADVVEMLARAATDRDHREAGDVAAHLVSPGVATILVGRLLAARHDEGRRNGLAQLLPGLGPEVGMALMEALREEALDDDADRSLRRSLLELVEALAEKDPSLLETMIRDPNWRVVRNAIQIIGDGDDAQAIESLTLAMAHDDGRVRREALHALAKVGGNDAGMLAAASLGDPDPSVRAQAARTLGVLRTERALPALVDRLGEEEVPAVTVDVIRTLGLLGDPSAVLPIERRMGGFFSRTPPEVRVAGFRALGAIGTPHAMELVRNALDDKDPQVRETARSLLSEQEP